MQEMFQQIQGSINAQTIQSNQFMGEIRNSIDALKSEVVDTKRQIQELATQLENIATNVQETEDRVTGIECQNVSITRDITIEEIEAAAYNIRIQGIENKKGEDVYEVAIESLAPLANYTTEEMRTELDYVYRMNTAFTKRTNMPPELIVWFLRRCMRDRVLKAIQGKQLGFHGKPITILKDIPWKVRQLRKQYELLRP